MHAEDPASDTLSKDQPRESGATTVDAAACLSQQSELLSAFERHGGFTHSLETRHFLNGEVLFREGDPGSELFVVQTGVAAVYQKSDGRDRLLARLYQGQAFGERALLGSGQRTATVIAEGPLSVFVFDRDRFLELYRGEGNVKRYFDTLERIYPLAGIGVVTQYSGEFLNRPAVNILIRRNDGSAMIATRLTDEPVFSIHAELYDESKVRAITFSDATTGIERRLNVAEGRLIGAFVTGPWEDIGTLHQLVIDRIPWTSDLDAAFIENGQLPETLLSLTTGYLCKCMHVAETTLRSIVEGGVTALSDLQDATGAGAVCGGCIPGLEKLLGVQTKFEDVVLSEIIEHPDNIRSYRFTPRQGQFSRALPGQHVLIAANLDGVRVERSYTLTSPASETAYREITVRRDRYGVFSNYLFKLKPGAALMLSPPKGEMILSPEDQSPLVCFTGGIGITPALGAVRSFIAANARRPVRVAHCANTQAGLTGRLEFESHAKEHDWLTYAPFVTTEHGRLTAKDIDIHTQSTDAQYLICGPGGFQKMVDEQLRRNGIPQDRILIETFGATGQMGNSSATESSVAAWLGFATSALFVAYALSGLDFFRSFHRLWIGSVLTGLALLALIAFQGRFSYLRWKQRWAAATKHKPVHQWLGVILPILLAMHTAKLGYGLSLVLSICLLLTSAAALLFQPRFARHRFRGIALTTHTALAVALVGFMLAHAWMALTF